MQETTGWNGGCGAVKVKKNNYDTMKMEKMQ